MYKGDTLYSCSEERIKTLFEAFSACADKKLCQRRFRKR